MWDQLLIGLAAAFLAGELSVDSLVSAGTHTLGHEWRWLRPLARRFAVRFAGGVRPRHRDAIHFLRNDDGFQRAFRRHRAALAIAARIVPASQMQPIAAAASWGLPPIESVGALAEWLGLTPSEVDWFADLKSLGYKRPRSRLHHYHYRVLDKGAGRVRLIEAPKPRLKQLQQQILAGILNRIPPHPSAHGFVTGRSVRSFASIHVGQRVVLRMDLRDFFPRLGGPRIQTVFRMLGYPESVANLLGGICTNAAPRDLWRGPGDWRELRDLYARPHLPQGAPTSPALANCCLYRADCRLAGLAEPAGAQYSRYADDLAFSGGEDFERRVDRFGTHVAAILLEEGFAVHHRKTRVMRQGVRQHLAGMVTNEKLNVRRDDFDRLKATLHNCIRLGPASQNRQEHADFRAHLAGRVAWVQSVNGARGERLRGLLERIEW